MEHGNQLPMVYTDDKATEYNNGLFALRIKIKK